MVARRQMTQNALLSTSLFEENKGHAIIFNQLLNYSAEWYCSFWKYGVVSVDKSYKQTTFRLKS